MVMSLFTPTHDGKFLQPLWNSLLKQTCHDFEWVVVPNGPHTDTIVAQLKAMNDHRIKIFPRKLRSASVRETIGSLKRHACEKCAGELLFELDHDDWLAPNCLEQVRDAYQQTDAGFIFTESVGIHPNGKAETYDKSYGWEYATHEYEGKQLPVMLNFDITPRSLSMIFWSPNHARVWSKDAYWKAGGHDAAMALADDHDLMCRTYLTRSDFIKIPEVLYYQRRHEAATSIQRWQEVAQLSTEIMNKYLHRLVYEWCRRERLRMVDLGGGVDCPRHLGFQALDRNDHNGVEYVVDVTDGAAVDGMLADNSVGCFRAQDFLEHIPIPQVIPLMNRLYDKLAPMGWLLSSTPAVCDNDRKVGLGAFSDPTHCSFWGDRNFGYFTDRKLARYCRDIRCRFQGVRVFTNYPNEWAQANSIPYVTADLMALKDGRVPGQCNI